MTTKVTEFPRLHAELLLAAPDEITSAVLKLHAPDGDGDCEGCGWGAYAEGPALWPCPTILLVNTYLHVAGIEA